MVSKTKKDAAVSVLEHFAEVAQKYRKLRITDMKPIHAIKNYLKDSSQLVAADVGCGSGRYSLKLLQHLPLQFLYCIDISEHMLQQLKNYFQQHNMTNFTIKQSEAHRLPLKNHSLDALFTFNAIHHFKMPEFLNEAVRVLKNQSYLFIYTRLRSQNRRTIWGRYFPKFHEKETRLFELDELKELINRTRGLKLIKVQLFKFKRVNSLDFLIEQATNRHYSTFSLYTEEEFKHSLKMFIRNIHTHIPNPQKITWFAENTLIVAKTL